MKNVLLVCGILSSLLYIAMNIYIPMLWTEYSFATQTVSELSAIGAPTRPVWVPLGVIYILLFAAFGWGVLKSAGENRRLHITGGLILAYCTLNIYWPPMHLRGHEMTLTDVLHIVWAMIHLLLTMLIMGFGAAALGKRFRLYTIASFAAFLVFGTLTGMEAPNLAVNQPTPTIGIWERINMGVSFLWVVVFAIALLRKEKTQAPGAFNAAKTSKQNALEL